jgi:CRP/FNR family cyclic AMP-dependent transcriptional regulator
MAMLAEDHRRSSTIVGVEPAVTLTLRFDEFRRLCQEHPAVQGLLVQMLAQRVERLSTHLVDALHLPADRRVLRTLLDLSGHDADSARTGAVTLPLTQVEVAELSGASRPTTNRYLRRLAADGLVRLKLCRLTES